MHNECSYHHVVERLLRASARLLHAVHVKWVNMQQDLIPVRHCYTSFLQVEKDEHYIRAVVALCATAEEVVKENNAIDIYERCLPSIISCFHAEMSGQSLGTMSNCGMTKKSPPDQVAACGYLLTRQ